MGIGKQKQKRRCKLQSGRPLINKPVAVGLGASTAAECTTTRARMMQVSLTCSGPWARRKTHTSARSPASRSMTKIATWVTKTGEKAQRKKMFSRPMPWRKNSLTAASFWIQWLDKSFHDARPTTQQGLWLCGNLLTVLDAFTSRVNSPQTRLRNSQSPSSHTTHSRKFPLRVSPRSGLQITQ